LKREWLLQRLAAHLPFDQEEQAMLEKLRRFVLENENCFERSLSIGHITGSAWIVDAGREHVLLTHHRRLDKWLQLGGHADGDPDVLQVALREAREESGIDRIRPVSESIFDVDIHEIPARGTEPAHFHYDVRFLLEADRSQILLMSTESKALAWVRLTDVRQLTGERSVLRMVEKTPRA
jgi:8-oxo-dGTP pyrophosphatase MutT (NUDIX family)